MSGRGTSTGDYAVHDLTLDAVSLGTAGYMLVMDADERGTLGYKLGTRHEHVFYFGPSFAGRRLGIIDTLRLTLFFDIETDTLIALTGRANQSFTFLFGESWGHWIDETGARYASEEPLAAMRRLKLPLWLDAEARELAVEFTINVRNREALDRDICRMFADDDGRHQLALTFKLPSGDFERAKVLMLETDTGQRKMTYRIGEFPLTWPRAIDRARLSEAPAAEETIRRLRPRPETASMRHFRPIESGGDETVASETDETTTRSKPVRAKLKRKHKAKGEEKVSPEERLRAAANGPVKARPRRASLAPRGGARHPEPGPGDPNLKPIRGTEKLPLKELLELLEAQQSEDRRWKIAEANLMTGRIERTYSLLARYTELIGERTRAWPPARLRTAFRDQPGGVLIGIMDSWSLNQVMAVAEGNPEEEKIMQWMREHEIDRMMGLDLDREPASTEDARRQLKIDKNADAKMIRRVWRVLLGFLNADLGRVDERAIHRKKDEIAKHLQVARDVLLRTMRD